MIQNALCFVGCGVLAFFGPSIGAAVFCENGRFNPIAQVGFVVGVLLVAQKFIF
jgi:hypothetical protein